MLPYSENDICALYRRAKNKNEQIKILAEINNTRKEKILKILNKYGYALERAICIEEKKNKKEIILAEIYCKYKELAESGATYKEAAFELGIDTRSVRAYARKHRIVFKND